MSLYHVLNRGVEKREIFLDDQDRARFVHDMYEFNTAHNGPTLNVGRRMIDLRCQSLEGEKPDRIVSLHGWCLMGNHYHLILSEQVDGGLSKFLRSLNIGYAKYFNEKYKRSGFLFQGRTKKVPIESDSHFLHILNYVHMNPLDFLVGAEDWREGKIGSTKTSIEHLHSYRWSSFLDYVGKKNFPSILSTDVFSEVFADYEKEIRDRLKERAVSSWGAFE